MRRLPRLTRCLLAAAALAAAGGGPAPPSADDGGDPPAGETAEARLLRRLNALCDARDPEAVAAWAAEMAADGRLRPGTPLGASLLAGAAHELTRVPGREGEALGLWREARASAAPASAARLEADWSVGRALLAAGDPAEALAALLEFERAARAGGLTAFNARESAFLETAARYAERASPRMRAEALLALGRFPEAADVLEATASRAAGDASSRAWDLFDDAARAAWRAGDRPRALRDAERSVAAAPAGRERVGAEQWLLLARHGLLDERGDPSPAGWPGDGFARDAREALARVQGSADAWSLALQVATFATLAGKPAESLPFFDWAFSDPAFLEAARTSGVERGQYLVAAQQALRAGDPERALRWLRTAESIAGGAIPGTASLRLRIDEALAERQGAEGRPRAGGPPPPEEAATGAPVGPPPPAAPPAGLGPPVGAPPDSPTPRDSGGGQGTDDAGGGVPWLGLAAGVLAIGLVTLAAARLRRRKH